MSVGSFKPHYRFYSSRYDPSSPLAKARVEELSGALSEALESTRGRVLDVCCGAGAFSFFLETLRLDVIGVDIQEEMVKKARAYSRRIGSRAEFMVMDARELGFPSEAFNAATLLGGSLPHFSIHDMDRIVSEVYRVLKPSSLFIVDLIDWISLLAQGYERSMAEANDKGEIMLSYHMSLNTVEGYVERLYHVLSTGEVFRIKLYLWAPWQARYVLEKNGFTLVDVRRLSERHYMLISARREAARK